MTKRHPFADRQQPLGRGGSRCRGVNAESLGRAVKKGKLSPEGLDATLAVAERLAGEGYAVVPHLTARLVRDGDHADEIVARLHAAGVSVQLAVWPNMLHVFPLFAPILSEGRDGCAEIGAFIRGKCV